MRVLNETYILPPIREADRELPALWMAKEPWPLADRIEGGPYADFRAMVWRSLLAYAPLRYDYFDAGRLVEIYFRRDETYPTIRALLDVDLLILVNGLVDLPNTYQPHLVRSVVGLRKMHVRPTWLYTARIATPPKAVTAAKEGKQLTARDAAM